MNTDILLSELKFSAVRSSGPGGQHVNKTSSKIVVRFDLDASQALRDAEKELLRKRLSNRISEEGVITMSCDESRSQHRNKAKVITRLLALIKTNLKTRKKRRKTKPSKKAIEKRLKDKRERAMKKKRRRQPPLE